MQQICTTMFFLIPKYVTIERPIAFTTTLIRWWEALRAPEVVKWQQKYRVDWDGTDDRHGGVQQTAWEILMKMERFKEKAKERRSTSLGLGPTWRRPPSGQSSCGVDLGDALQFPRKELASAVR